VPSSQGKILGSALASLEITAGDPPPSTPPISVFEFKTAEVEGMRKDLAITSRYARYFVEELVDGTTLEMVEVPANTFLIGSPVSEAHRSSYEGPQRRLGIKSFFIGKYAVTQAQWRAVSMLPKKRRYLPPDPSKLIEGDNLPVIRVSWDDAIEFCSRLSEHTGRTYSLPTEAQWEYACRAGTQTAFAFGDTLPFEIANYGGHYLGQDGKYRVRLVEVGVMGVANQFGLYDMHGNVYEWCMNARNQNYEELFTDGSPPESSGNAKYRVRRGGSWQSKESACRSAHRSAARRWLRNDITGFRVVMLEQ
jgi:formylglycine-generating enzyme required for sulfatase activity